MKRIILILSVVATLLGAASTALPCSCVYFPKHSKSFREAKAIFVGEVISVDSSTPIPEELKGEVAQAIKFRVERSWKGAKSSELITWLHGDSFACSGWKFREGEKYLVYADEYQGHLIVHSFCSRSRPLGQENEDTRREMRQLNSFWFRWRSRLLPF